MGNNEHESHASIGAQRGMFSLKLEKRTELLEIMLEKRAELPKIALEKRGK